MTVFSPVPKPPPRSLKKHPKGIKRVPAEPSAKTTARFWRFVEKGDGCWLWTGARNPAGYGVFGAVRFGDRAEVLAHRVSYCLANGGVPAGLFVCHHCDTPPCVRPDHLFVGTVIDNYVDMMRKGRGQWTNHKPRTHCQRGHELTASNRFMITSGRGPWQSPGCRICRREYNRLYMRAYNKVNPRRRRRSG